MTRIRVRATFKSEDAMSAGFHLARGAHTHPMAHAGLEAALRGSGWRSRGAPTLFALVGDVAAEINSGTVAPPHVACILGMCQGPTAVVWRHARGARQRVDTFHACGRKQSTVEFERTPDGWVVVSHCASAPLVLRCGGALPVLSPLVVAAAPPRPKRVLAITPPDPAAAAPRTPTAHPG